MGGSANSRRWGQVRKKVSWVVPLKSILGSQATGRKDTPDTGPHPHHVLPRAMVPSDHVLITQTNEKKETLKVLPPGLSATATREATIAPNHTGKTT